MEMTLSLDSIEHYQKYLSANGSPDNTVKAYTTDLKMLWKYVGDQDTIQDFETKSAEYLTSCMKDGLAPSTIRRKRAAFRAYAAFLGQDILSKYKTPRQPPAFAHPVEGGYESILKMLETARRDHQKALVALQALCGLRVSEAISVRADDFTFGDTITLRVYGKGYKTRYVPVSIDAWVWISPAWSAARRVQGDTRLVPVSNRVARQAITSISKRAGVKSVSKEWVASHDLRCTFATMAAASSGWNLALVQELLGHQSVETTRNYIMVSAQAKADAVNFGEKN